MKTNKTHKNKKNNILLDIYNDTSIEHINQDTKLENAFGDKLIEMNNSQTSTEVTIETTIKSKNATESKIQNIPTVVNNDLIPSAKNTNIGSKKK